jgi:hypothetical protein
MVWKLLQSIDYISEQALNSRLFDEDKADSRSYRTESTTKGEDHEQMPMWFKTLVLAVL